MPSGRKRTKRRLKTRSQPTTERGLFMECPECSGETVPFPVPEEYRPLVPGEESGAALCQHCLSLHPNDNPPAKPPDFRSISTAFPGESEAAVPMALVVGLLSNLALHRSEIADLLEDIERAGTDPLLVLDRLAHDAALEPAVDLAGRRRQLEQLL